MDIEAVIEKVLRYVKHCLENEGLGLFSVIVQDDGGLNTLFPNEQSEMSRIYQETEHKVLETGNKNGIYVSNLHVHEMASEHAASEHAIGLLCWDRGRKITKIFPYVVESGMAQFLDGVMYDGHDSNAIEQPEHPSSKVN